MGEERFAALERLTTFELKDMKRRQDEEQLRRQQDIIEKQKQEQERGRHGRDRPDTKSDTSSIKESKSTDEELEGMLVRKHEWESTTKKASNSSLSSIGISRRSWDRICVVLKGTQILFYRDQKTYRTRPEETFRSELPVDLIGGTAEVAADYTKKKHVFRLRLANGGDYLFQAGDDDQMNVWVNSINQQAHVPEEGSGKSQTLPPGSEKKDEPKRRSFFTLKKN